MSFSDDFNRANETLETSANWTCSSNNVAKVTSNRVGADVGTEMSAKCPDQSSADHYTQVSNVASSWGSFATIRMADKDNYIGMRANGTAYEVFKRVASSFTSLGSYSTTPSAGDTLYLEGSGNSITFKLNGTIRVTATESAGNTNTRQGFNMRNNTPEMCDDFSAGSLAAAASPNYLTLLGVGA